MPRISLQDYITVQDIDDLANEKLARIRATKPSLHIQIDFLYSQI